MLGNFEEKQKLNFIFSQWRTKDGEQAEAGTLGHRLEGTSAPFAVILKCLS